jgi:hypothetical protein
MAVFWVLAPCSLVEVCRRFRGACCLHHQGKVQREWHFGGEGGVKGLYSLQELFCMLEAKYLRA